MSELTVKDVNRELYMLTYGSVLDRDYDTARKLWSNVKNNEVILRGAATLRENGIFDSLIIVEYILMYYRGINTDILQDIANKVFGNKILMEHGKYEDGTFLWYVLRLKGIVLDDKQKALAISVALDHESTIKHGRGNWNIRYMILMNKNFSDKQKRSIIFEGFPNDKEWLDFIDEHKAEVENNLRTLYHGFNKRGIEDIDINKLRDFTNDLKLNKTNAYETIENLEYTIDEVEFIRYALGIRPIVYGDTPKQTQISLSGISR